MSLVSFSDAAVQSIGWTLIDSAAAANNFATAIQTTPRPFAGGTGLTGGMTLATSLFANNGYEGTRRVIDVVGDGAESNVCSFSALNCVPLQTARANALGSGVTSINALWIDDRDFFGDDPTDIINALTYGTTNVIGGAGAFQGIVQDFAGFQAAITGKLEREVTGVPEPATTALLGLALAGLGWARRRRSQLFAFESCSSRLAGPRLELTLAREPSLAHRPALDANVVDTTCGARSDENVLSNGAHEAL